MIHKICKHHGKLNQEHIRIKKNNKTVCILCDRESAKKYRDANRKKVYAAVKKYTENNKEKIKSRKYHRRRSSDDIKKSNRTKVENLTDSYIKTLLTNHGSNLKIQDISMHLVQAKRAVIKLQRKLKELEK